jgi:putative N6-adenine-specific DNA methylase
MDAAPPLELFLVSAPGLEAALMREAHRQGYPGARTVPGGVSVDGSWPDIWRANLTLRGATRVLMRLDSFRAMHLAQLDKRARKIDWASVLRPDVPVRVEASCAKSKIYHAGAAAQRVERAISETLGAPLSDDAEVRVLVRIEDDLATISIDTTGEPLHKRGHKQAVNRAPMRESLAALFLYEAGFTGTEPVYDPMCGSGTFPIEAAEIATGLHPGRTRSFAFEHLATFRPALWDAMKRDADLRPTPLLFFGSDGDVGAIAMARDNAERAGVSDLTRFSECDIADLTRPDSPPGLVIINPPYGARLGDPNALVGLYRTLGQSLARNFSGWRVGLIAANPRLAQATGLPFAPPLPPVLHGGIRIRLHLTKALK